MIIVIGLIGAIVLAWYFDDGRKRRKKIRQQHKHRMAVKKARTKRAAYRRKIKAREARLKRLVPGNKRREAERKRVNRELQKLRKILKPINDVADSKPCPKCRGMGSRIMLDNVYPCIPCRATGIRS